MSVDRLKPAVLPVAKELTKSTETADSNTIGTPFVPDIDLSIMDPVDTNSHLEECKKDKNDNPYRTRSARKVTFKPNDDFFYY